MRSLKIISCILSLVLLAAIAFSSPTAKRYGKKITIKNTTKISDILASPEKYDGKRVVVEGEIADVCQNQGCWINILSDDAKERVRFKVRDGEIVFPKDAAGKKALAQGIVTVKMKTAEEQISEGKHFAEESGKTFDPATVSGPKAVVTIKGEGAVLK